MKDQKINYFLGIDWGASRVGLAIADDELRIASGLNEVPTLEAWGLIKQLDKEYDFAKLIIGIPEHKGFHGKKELEDFLIELEKFGKEVVKENEFFSTKVAQANLSVKNVSGISHDDNVEAARLILQGWLDKSSKK